MSVRLTRPTRLPIDPFGTPDRGFDTMRVTSPYGIRVGLFSGFHGGVDIGNARSGDEIIAMADGLVILATSEPSPPWNYPSPTDKFSTWGPSYGGNVVILDHGSGIFSQYAHMRSPIFVPRGVRLVRGDTIGFVGNTGSALDGGAHLHNGVRDLAFVNNNHNGWVDPWLRFVDSATGDIEDEMLDPEKHLPIARARALGGTVYGDPDRRTVLEKSLKPQDNVGVYARTAPIRDESGKLNLVPIHISGLYGKRIGWIGPDQLTDFRLAGEAIESTRITQKDAILVEIAERAMFGKDI